MKLQGVDTVKEIAILKVICILKSNNNFNKNGIIKFFHFPFTLVATKFSTKSIWLDFFLQRVTQGLFLPNYLAIGQADYGGKGLLKFEYFSHVLMPQQQKFYTECKSLNNFEK